MEPEKQEFVCVNCLQPSSTLFQKYSEGVIRLTECMRCGNLVDKYIEFDTVLVVVDLILQYVQAYRHLLCNTKIEKPFRLAVLFLFCHAYDKWIVERTSTGAKQIYDLELIFYKSILTSAVEIGTFISVILLLEYCTAPKIDSRRQRKIITATLFGFYGNVAVMLSIVFRLSSQLSYRIVVQIFLFISHFQVQQVLFPDAQFVLNAFVVMAAQLASFLSGFVPSQFI